MTNRHYNRLRLGIEVFDTKNELRRTGLVQAIPTYEDVIWFMREQNEPFLNEVRLERFNARIRYVRHFNRL